MTKVFILCALLSLGVIFPVQAEDQATLEQRLRQQLAVQPDNLDARFQLARALSWQKRYDDALAEFSRLLKARPDNADFLLGIAQVHLWRGAPEMSLPFLRKARRLAPNYEDVWRAQIQALLALGDADRLRQARLIRGFARSRFPRSDWTFAGLDASPVAAATITLPPIAAPALPQAVVTPPTPPAAIANAPAPAQQPNRYEWEAGFSDEALTNGLQNWRSRYFIAEWHRPDRTVLYGGVRETERYALDDREVHLGGILPLGASTQTQFEAGCSNSHRVLAKRYALIQFQYQPAPAWSLESGWRRSDYDNGFSTILHLTLDRYVGNERFGYTLYEGGPDGGGLSPSHRLQWAHYYGERDWIGLSHVRGRETEYAGNAAFLTSQVSGESVSGRHSVAPDYALIWDVGRLHQGESYTRSGVRLGLRHDF